MSRPTVLDPTPPLDVAAYGNTLAWLRPTDAKGTRAQLVVRDAAGTVRVVDRSLPAHANDLTIGLDRPAAS